MSGIHFNGSLSHAYILACADADLRLAEAKRLAAAMLCSSGGEPCGNCRHCRKVQNDIHPDLIVVERDVDSKGNVKRELQVDKIRSMVADASIMPNEAEAKVYLIRDADTMNISAQNAILKLLEEPPGNACFILCAESAESFLRTVRSRCAEIFISAEPQQEAEGEVAGLARQYLRAAASGDRLELLRFTSSCEKLKPDMAIAFTDAVCSTIADILTGRFERVGMENGKLFELAELMSLAGKYLRANVGVKHVFGLLSVRTF